MKANTKARGRETISFTILAQEQRGWNQRDWDLSPTQTHTQQQQQQPKKKKPGA